MFRKASIVFILFVVALASCTAFSGLSGNVTAEETESAELAVAGAPAVEVTHFAGTITIREGNEGLISATVTKQSRLEDEAAAQAQLEEITLVVEEAGDGARVVVEGPEGFDNLSDLDIGFSAELEVTVPPGSDLTVELGAGEITVEQPTGDLFVTNGAGEVTVILPADASFNLQVSGGVADVNSEFEGVPDGGVATDIQTTVGDNPTQTLTFELGAGELHLRKAP
jgi:hypothetical protein